MNLSNTSTYSFDVFDSVLTRAWGSTFGLYVYIGEQLRDRGWIRISPVEWARIRQKTEHALWKTLYRHSSVTLQDIYQKLGQVLLWDGYTIQRAIEIEVREEIESLRPIPNSIELLKRVRTSCNSVVFLSDMHLSSKVISEALARNHILNELDIVVSSSCKGATKASGRLFEKLLDESVFSKGSHTHFGDNYSSDIRAARAAGLQAIHITAGHLSRYEAAIANHRELPPKFRSLLAGAMRLARTHSNSSNCSNINVIGQVGANVVGPLLVGYALWLIKKSEQQQIQRLYFLARDGQLPLRIAQALQPTTKLEMRYLYASRQAWHLPSITKLGTEDFSWIFDGLEKSLTIENVAARLGIDTCALESILQQQQDHLDKRELPLSDAHVELIKWGLLTNAELIREIHMGSAQAREVVSAYLRQEGLFDTASFAIVDTGWHCRLQRSLGRILRLSGNNSITTKGFYFGLKARSIDDIDSAEAYFDDCGSGKRADLCNAPIIEIFTEADHGTTIGYRRDHGNQCVPVLKEHANTSSIDWGLLPQQEAAEKFALVWQETCQKYPIDAEVEHWRIAATTLLEMFVFDPSVAEAIVYGSFPKTSSQNHDDATPLASEISLIEGLLRLIPGNAKLFKRRSDARLWPSGSLRRSGHFTLSKIYHLQKRIQWNVPGKE